MSRVKFEKLADILTLIADAEGGDANAISALENDWNEKELALYLLIASVKSADVLNAMGALTPQTIDYAAAIVADASKGRNMIITLSGDVTNFSIVNAPAGASGTITLVMDGTGHSFAIPAAAPEDIMGGDLTDIASVADEKKAKIAWDYDGISYNYWVSTPSV